MVQLVLKWFRNAYKKTITSIAFLPAVISLSFLVLSFFMIEFDFSPSGKHIKSNLHWLSLKDAQTARSICTTIAGGVISLAVFSFSMVMILLNQAASLMSNRILDKLIGNRFQQLVLGFYVGTIVYALFLLSTIRDINSGVTVPAISTYLLIALTVFDIFLFIYFIHYITQTIKYETIIHRIYTSCRKVMVRTCPLNQEHERIQEPADTTAIGAYKSGLYQGYNKNNLLALCEEEDVIIYFLHPIGTYVMEGVPMLTVDNKRELSTNFETQLSRIIDIEMGQEIDKSYTYGLKQLMEIAIKALSPGINDPGTAVISLQAIGDLLAYRLQHFPELNVEDKKGTIRIIIKEKNFDEAFENYFMPVWDYGKNDRSILHEMVHILKQLKMKGEQPIINKLLVNVQFALNSIE